MQVNEAKRMITSDCKVLVDAARRNCIENLPSWQAAQKVAQCARLYQDIEHNHPIPMSRNEGSPAGAHTGKFGETNRPIL